MPATPAAIGPLDGHLPGGQFDSVVLELPMAPPATDGDDGRMFTEDDRSFSTRLLAHVEDESLLKRQDIFPRELGQEVGKQRALMKVALCFPETDQHYRLLLCSPSRQAGGYFTYATIRAEVYLILLIGEIEMVLTGFGILFAAGWPCCEAVQVDRSNAPKGMLPIGMMDLSSLDQVGALAVGLFTERRFPFHRKESLACLERCILIVSVESAGT
jgi:hypothetical protein